MDIKSKNSEQPIPSRFHSISIKKKENKIQNAFFDIHSSLFIFSFSSLLVINALEVKIFRLNYLLPEMLALLVITDSSPQAFSTVHCRRKFNILGLITYLHLNFTLEESKIVSYQQLTSIFKVSFDLVTNISIGTFEIFTQVTVVIHQREISLNNVYQLNKSEGV